MAGCQKEELSSPNAAISNRAPDNCSSVALTYSSIVNVGEDFTIDADVECGRISIQQGYVLSGLDTVWVGLDCNSANLQWKQLAHNLCYTEDASVTLNVDEAGSYVFRTSHLAADGNCDNFNPSGPGNPGDCEFSGNNFCCFEIEAVSACETEFTGEALSCDETRQAIFTLTSADALGYVKIQGGLTNFTGEDAIVTVSPADFTISQRTPGGSSNRVITVEGSLDECETVTITIFWNSSNGGDIITGEWSAKDSAGVEVAPSVQGLTCAP